MAGIRALFTAAGLGIVSLALLPVAFGSSQTASPIVRNALAQSAKVQGAPGRTLVLSRVVVQPGAKIALHHHLGTQVARVAGGVLTYTVREGSVVVRKGESEDPQTVRTIKAGQAGRIRAGQWIVEQPSTVHEAANNGTEPVVIYIATLLKTGARPSTPVTPSASG